MVRHNNVTLPPVTFTGASVSSVSRSGSKPDKWAAGQSWVDKVSWTKGDPTTGDMSSAFSGASAVVSCVGVIGGSDEEMEKGNGDVNVAAASQVQSLLHIPALDGANLKDGHTWNLISLPMLSRACCFRERHWRLGLDIVRTAGSGWVSNLNRSFAVFVNPATYFPTHIFSYERRRDVL